VSKNPRKKFQIYRIILKRNLKILGERVRVRYNWIRIEFKMGY
jgi:hypothetical protein